jgi:hypothetical protein
LVKLCVVSISVLELMLANLPFTGLSSMLMTFLSLLFPDFRKTISVIVATSSENWSALIGVS